MLKMPDTNPPSGQFQNPLDSWEQPWNKMTYFWHNDPPEVVPVQQPLYNANTGASNLWTNPSMGWAGNQALQTWENPWKPMSYFGFPAAQYFTPLAPAMPLVGYTAAHTNVPDVWRWPNAMRAFHSTEQYACKVIEVGAPKEPPSPFLRVSDNTPCEMVGAIRPPPLMNIRAPLKGCSKCLRGRGASCRGDVENSVIPRSFPKRLKGNPMRPLRLMKFKKSPNIVRFDKDYVRRWKDEAKTNSLQDMFREIRESRSCRLRPPGHPELCRFCNGPLSAFGFCKNCSIFSSVDIRTTALPTVQEVNETQSTTEPFTSGIQASTGGTDDNQEGGTDDKDTEDSTTGDDADSNRICLCYMAFQDSAMGIKEEGRTPEPLPVVTIKPPCILESSDMSDGKFGDSEGPGRVCVCGMHHEVDSDDNNLPVKSNIEPMEGVDKIKNEDNSTKDEEKERSVTHVCLCDDQPEEDQDEGPKEDQGAREEVVPPQSTPPTEQTVIETKRDAGVETEKQKREKTEEETVRICLCVMENWENAENTSPPPSPHSSGTHTDRKKKAKHLKEMADVSICVHPCDVTSQDAEIQTTPCVVQFCDPTPTQTDELPSETIQTQTETVREENTLPAFDEWRVEIKPIIAPQEQPEGWTSNSSDGLILSDALEQESDVDLCKKTPFGAAMNVGNAAPHDITVVLYSNRVIVAEVVQRKLYCESILSQTWELPSDADDSSIRCFLGKGILLVLTDPPPETFVWPFSSPLVCLGAPTLTTLPCKIDF